MFTWKISEKEGDLEVFAQVEVIGDDLLVILWGGTEPHIGAIGMAQPRPSLKDPRTMSATSSVFTFLGHKEDIVVKEISEGLASKLNRKVVVVAGMHWEGLQDEGIGGVVRICRRIKEKVLQKMEGI
ncbi:MAG: hypothetical protein DRG50_00450 [Deltaproteobacteria bacterium]|nr:MAG: hypothetical protein DRG50_00450 [Deltaproteobacteria bacterium]